MPTEDFLQREVHLGESLGLSSRRNTHAQQLVELVLLLHVQKLLSEVQHHLHGRIIATLTAAEM